MNRTITKLLLTGLFLNLYIQNIQAQNKINAAGIAIEPIDSSLAGLEKLTTKYISVVDNKIQKYNKAVSSKIESSLTKLARWEQKIKRTLEKVDKPTADRLFGNNQTTFQSLLEKYNTTKQIADQYTAEFNHYQDKLSINLKYLQKQQTGLKKVGKNIDSVLSSVSQMNQESDNAAYLESFIKERRKLLMSEAYQLIGKSKYFSKLNKESYYYIETVKNYKAILSDSKKTEELVVSLLKKIPAFQDFASQNSQLSGVFPSLNSLSFAGNGNIPIVNGLASRVAVQQYMTNSGMNAALLISQLQNNTPQNSQEFSSLQNKLEEAKETLESLELPKLKVNTQKTKTLKERFQTDLDLDFGKSTGYLPARANTALMIGYKLSDKQVAGIGLNYVMGLGNGWRDIRISNEGIGLRTYLRWKMKYDIYLQANGEWTYMLRFNNVEALKNMNDWQTAALAGISKSYKISKKIKGNFQILYNFLHNRNYPQSQPLVIRMGYGL